jgi:predicted transcriptional regulator
VRALSIRQPYAELILRGIKTVEYRTRPTTIVGERFYIYASKKSAESAGIWSKDLAAPRGLPDWMLELAEQVGMIEPVAVLPTGVIVGSAVIDHVSQVEQTYRWHLIDVQRASVLRKPERHPQPSWFRPF